MKKFTFNTLITLLTILSLYTYGAVAAHTPETVFTVQISTHNSMERALIEFDHITSLLQEQQLDSLRIEEIGRAYTLRLGKFASRDEAGAFVNSLGGAITSYLILKAYFIETRIKKIYNPSPQDIIPASMPATPPPIQTPASAEPEASTEVENDSTQAQALQSADIPVQKQLSEVSELVSQKKYDAALGIMKEKIAKMPDSPDINAWYGAVLLKKGKPATALQHLEKAAALAPDSPDYLNGVGYCYYYLDRYEKAIEAFTHALNLQPEHLDALAGIGIIYAKKGDREKAVNVYNKLMRLEPESAGKLLKIIDSKTLPANGPSSMRSQTHHHET